MLLAPHRAAFGLRTTTVSVSSPADSVVSSCGSGWAPALLFGPSGTTGLGSTAFSGGTAGSRRCRRANAVRMSHYSLIGQMTSVFHLVGSGSWPGSVM